MQVKVSKDKYDCFNEPDLICPFCGYRNPDSWDYDLNESGVELECPNCGRTFIAISECVPTYTTYPISTHWLDTWEVGDYFEDGCETEEDEQWCNEQHYCERKEK